MATKHRRVTISLPPEVDKAVVALAAGQGIPHSKVITNILLEFVPTMNGLAKMMNQIKAGQSAQAKDTMRHMFGDNLASMLQEQMPLPIEKKKKK